MPLEIEPNLEPERQALNFSSGGVAPNGVPPRREVATLSADGLSGLRVLLAEDESHVQMLIEDFLVKLGCEVQVVSTLDAALRAAREADIDVAVLDVNLNGQQSFPAAAALSGRHIPFVFLTGYASQGFEATWKDRPWLLKPFVIDQLAQALRSAVSRPANPSA